MCEHSECGIKIFVLYFAGANLKPPQVINNVSENRNEFTPHTHTHTRKYIVWPATDWMYHFGPKIRPTCFVLAYAAACVFLFLCNVIKMIKMVCSRAISSWYICWSLGICAYISFVYGEMLYSGALCVCGTMIERERERPKYSQTVAREMVPSSI